MITTELYVIRHGKTMFNALQRAQGWCDTPLTSKGAPRHSLPRIGLTGHAGSCATVKPCSTPYSGPKVGAIPH